MLRGGLTHNVLLFYSQVFSLFFFFLSRGAMPAVAYNLVFSFSGRDLSACWFRFHARVLAIAANAKRCLSSRTVDFASPCDFDLHLFCSGSLHSLWTWQPSTPRSILTTSSFMSGILFPLRSPKFIVASQESPIFFFSFFLLPSLPPHRSLLWPLTSYLSASPAAKALMRFLFEGEVKRGPRTVLLAGSVPGP